MSWRFLCRLFFAAVFLSGAVALWPSSGAFARVVCVLAALLGVGMLWNVLCARWRLWRLARVAERSGDAEACLELAAAYRHGELLPRDRERALAFFRRAADQGEPLALYCLGMYHLLGEDGLPRDEAAAFDFFSAAAEAGAVDGVWSVGLCYWYGLGVEVSLPLAQAWLEQAVEEGDEAMAPVMLARLRGVAVEEPLLHALDAFTVLSENPMAMFELSQCYAGLSGARRREAALWLSLASKAGYRPAQEALGKGAQ